MGKKGSRARGKNSASTMLEAAACSSDNLEQSFSAPDSIPTSGHSILLEGLASEENFVRMCSINSSKQNEFDLQEILPVLTKEEQTAMWGCLLEFVSGSMPAVLRMEEDHSSQVILGAVSICKICMAVDMVVESPPQGLKSTLQTFSSNLINLQKIQYQGVEQLAKCLEAAYSANIDDREELIRPVLKYLITRSLSSKGTKADVKRVWCLHQVLLTQRLDEGLREEFLLECVGHPLYLSIPEGVRFLVFLFSLSVSFVQDLHKKIKTSLNNLTAKQAYTLGEVYQRAWTVSGGEFRSSIERGLQQLMDGGMLIRREKNGVQLAKNVGRLLKNFDNDKRNQQLQSMIARLYKPFIFRYLKANNPHVRVNAAEIFFSAYPIEDRTMDIYDRSLEVEKQHTLICQLLKDDIVEVRVTAVLGVGNILSSYWLMIPSETIRRFLEPIVRDLSVDSDYRVRVAVFQCLSNILKDHSSHLYMKDVLPMVNRSLHDVNEKVRQAFVNMLLSVKIIISIRFWDICDLENLLSRLEVDRPVVSRGIVKLLQPSFFPKNGGVEQNIKRCIKINQVNRAAARIFYSISINFTEKETLFELMVGILNSVKLYLRNRSTNKQAGKENSEIRKRKLYSSTSSLDDSAESINSTVSTSSLSTTSSTILESTVLNDPNAQNVPSTSNHPYDDINTVGGVLDTVCVLWHNLNLELYKEENQNYRALLEKTASQGIQVYFKHYRDTTISDTIIYLGGFLSHSSATIVASYCLSQLKKSSKFEIYAYCMCMWRRGEEVLDLLKEWIGSGLSKPQDAEETGGVRFREPDAEEPKVNRGILVVNYILDSPVTRLILLKKNLLHLVELMQSTNRVLLKIQENLGFQDITVEREKELVGILQVHLKLVVTLGLQNKDVIEKMEDIVSWADQQLLPLLSREIEANQISVSMAEKCVSALLFSLHGVLQTGSADKGFIGNLLDFLQRVLPHLSLAELLLDILHESSWFTFTSGFHNLHQERIPISLVHFLRGLMSQGKKLDQNQVDRIRLKLTKFFRMHHKLATESEDSLHTFQDIAEVISNQLLESTKRELEDRGVDEVQSMFEEEGGVRVCLGPTLTALTTVIVEYKESEQMLSTVLQEISAQVTGVDSLSVLCLAYSLQPAHRLAILDSLKTRVSALLSNPEPTGEDAGEPGNEYLLASQTILQRL